MSEEKQPDEKQPEIAQPDTAALQKELEALKASLTEKDEAVKFWYEKASSGEKPKAKVETEVPDDDDTDLLDLISKSGSKGLKGWMAKQGFVSAAEVDKRVQERAGQFTREAELVRSYPDLKDESSDFFKATAREFQKLKGKVSDDMAMEMAAERVELAQLRSGKKTDAKDGDKKEKQQEREERAKAQSGDKGKSKPADDDDDSDLTAEQLAICTSMGIEPEAYKKRAKSGVQYAGKK